MKNCHDEPGSPVTAATGLTLGSFRRLKWNELVTRGDFVEDGHQGFALWEGPSGFRADAFVKPIFRRSKGASSGAAVPR